MGNLAPKNITLAANVPASIVWNGADFQAAHGSGIIQVPIGIRLTVQNDTLQTVYIGLSYKTLTNEYVIVDAKSRIGVQRGTTQSFGANSLGSMGLLERDLTQLTATLISAAPGNVTLTLELTSPNQGGTSSDAQRIGADLSNIDDFVMGSVYGTGLIYAAVSPIINSYVVPSGKRWKLHDLMIGFSRQLFSLTSVSVLTIDGATGNVQTFTYSANGDNEVTTFNINGLFAELKAGDTLRFRIETILTTIKSYRYQMAYEEYLL